VPVRQALLKCDRMELDCILEPEERWVRGAKEDGDFHVCESFEEMLEQDIDAVLLTTPNHIHEVHTVAAASAGKHVFVEKPIANRLDEAERMIRACRENDVVLAVGHSSRFNAMMKTTKRLLDEGAFGTLCGFTVVTSHDNIKQDGKVWKSNPAVTPCPALMQLAIHQIDSLLSFFGPVASVFSRHQVTTEQYEMTDTAHIMLRFENGLTGTISCFYLVPQVRVWNFYGTAARMTAGEGGLQLLREGASEPERVSLESEHGGAVEMLEMFAAAVLDGSTYPIDGEAGARALAVAWASILSSELGREVTIAETLEQYGWTLGDNGD
jgi:predicted dehydrogenase